MRPGESWPPVPLSELQGEVSCSTCDRGPYKAGALTLSRVPILTRASWLWIPAFGGWVCPTCQARAPGPRRVARSMRIRRIRERLSESPALYASMRPELQELEEARAADARARKRSA